MTTDQNAERVAELEADNSRLRRLLDQRDAPYELRHRLRSTLALLRAIVRRSANTERDLPNYVAHLEDRLEAITRAQAIADQHGEVNLRVLITDELFYYGVSEGEQLLLSGADVRLQPKAGQVFALAVHELAINAIEHGALGQKGDQIEVSWRIAELERDQLLVFSWRESTLPSIAGSVPGGFGTEVLTHMLAYDLNAETEMAFGADDLRCTISFALSEHVGRVVPG